MTAPAAQRALTFVPKLVTSLKGYDRHHFAADLMAGTIVGIVALPLAIAFAIASGVSPERGLITAIVAGFLISALGGSRVQIGGPTGAFVVIVYGIVQKYGLEGLTVATLMAGVLLVVMGFARLGQIIKFIPHPVVTGFTSGIAVVIFSSQVKDFLGLRMGDVPAGFLQKWAAFGQNLTSVNPWALAIAALSLAIIILWPLVSRRLPGAFVAIVLTAILVSVFDLPVDTVSSRFGELRATLPLPVFPTLSLDQTLLLVGPAFSIALLGAIESLLSAVVADGMIGSRHRSNMELVAQGIANLASPLFGGIPATGAIARTATNVKNGGRSPVAGITHAVVLLLITVLFGRWAGLIPLPALAAILVVVAYHMSEWRTFQAELRAPKGDVAVLIAVFALTVLVDLTVAIQVGMVLASFLFMQRMAEVTNVTAVTKELRERTGDDPDEEAANVRAIPDGIEIYEISGAFFFGAAETFKDTLGFVAKKPKVLILRMRDVSLLDSTGVRALRDVVHRSKKENALVIISEVHAQPAIVLERSTLKQELGAENVVMTLEDALARARAYLATRLPTPAMGTPVGGPA
ncbi:MAG: SulP family inorganic anion transporter [Gemmatimonadaceae bacterium]